MQVERVRFVLVETPSAVSLVRLSAMTKTPVHTVAVPWYVSIARGSLLFLFTFGWHFNLVKDVM